MGIRGRVDLSLRKRNLERGNKEEDGNVISGEKEKRSVSLPWSYYSIWHLAIVRVWIDTSSSFTPITF